MIELCMLMTLGLAQAPAKAMNEIKVRIGDLTDIRGVRKNQLVGMGVVTGLTGTGDQQTATKQAIVNLLKLYDLNIAVGDVNAGNTALVIVTATLDPFKSNGANVDITVSAMEAKSLAGGMLLRTPLRGADGLEYVVAQGPVSLGGGYQAVGAAASATKGHLTVGTIPNGGLVEREIQMQMVSEGNILKLDLRFPDFKTSKRIVEAINEIYPNSALAKDPSPIWVYVPEDVIQSNGVVAFVSSIFELEVVPDSPAIIVINERTGTLVSGDHVRIRPAGIAHGSLTITVEETPVVSQPAPFSSGETTTVDRTSINVIEAKQSAQVFPGAISVSDLVNSLNTLKVTPRDIIAILQALKKAGALHAQLETM